MELSPRELAVRFTNTKKSSVSEASLSRPLKAPDLITSPAYIVIRTDIIPRSSLATSLARWASRFSRNACGSVRAWLVNRIE
jgi:hypothetical protein